VKVVNNVVRLDSGPSFRVLAATNAAPPGLTPLYCSDDLHVYAGVEEGRVRYYFAVMHNSVYYLCLTALAWRYLYYTLPWASRLSRPRWC